MPPRTKQGSKTLGAAIRQRREELGFTVEQAANRARIGTKTWTRYESGASIRSDKVHGVCIALGWKSLDEGAAAVETADTGGPELAIDEGHVAWSPYLESVFGRQTAIRFCVGSDILLDDINMDLEELAVRPRGTHLGEIGISLTKDLLPEQFLTRYDYEFLCTLRARLEYLRLILHERDYFLVHMVADEILLHAIEAESDWLDEELGDELDAFVESWADELCEGADCSFFFETEWLHLGQKRTYHFDHWFEQVFNSSDPDIWYGPFFEFNEYNDED